jgi:adenosylmethionine-8-amino-7-oxononanoate aminotransferase
VSSVVERDLAVFWHPCSRAADLQDSPPLEVVAARGARLTLADGRQVLDGISSWWCKSLGHGHPGVRARIERQLARFEHVIAANTTHGDLVELCERLVRLADGEGGARHFGKVFLAENGSTAVEIALKMAVMAQSARGAPGRTRFAALAGGYHGETVGALSVGDLGLYADPFRALMFPVTKLGPLPHRAGPEDPAWMDCGREWPAIETALAAEAPSLAAIVYEPVLQAAGQMRLHSPDLLARLRRWADAHGVFLVADEIAAGMGRLGAMLASHLVGGAQALPDFAVLSKGLTAGFMPLAAVVTTDEVFALIGGSGGKAAGERRPAFLHSNTYAGHALAVAAALGALDAFESEDVLAQVARKGRLLRAALADAARSSAVLAGTRGCGMVAAIDLRAPDGSPLPVAAGAGRRAATEALRRGMLVRPLGDTLYLFPPLNTPDDDLDTMVEILVASATAGSR